MYDYKSPERKEYMRQWRRNNKEWLKNWRTENLDRIHSQRSDKYYADHDAAKDYHRKRAYKYRDHKVSFKDRENLIAVQDGKCAICSDNTKTLQVDHDHETGAYRGMLCPQCNMGLGHWKDNPLTIMKAIQYLMYHNKKNNNK